MTRINGLTVLAGALAMTMSALAFTPAQAAPNGELHGGQSSHSSISESSRPQSGFSSFEGNRQLRFGRGPELPDHSSVDPSCALHRHPMNPAWGCENDM